MEADSSRPRKQARASQACRQCREKKIRCDGKPSGCSFCSNRGLDCSYPGIQRRRGPGKSKQRMQELEERLQSMESLLRRGDAAYEDKGSREPPSRQGSEPTGQSAVGSATPLGTGDAQTTVSEAKTLEPQVSELKGLGSLAQRFVELRHWKAEQERMCSKQMVPSPVLPKRQEVFLVEGAIDDLFGELPLFYVPAFIETIRAQHTRETCGSSTWWCILNAVIARAIQRKSINTFFIEMAVVGWGFFKNAFAVLPELLVQDGGVEAVQAVLAMAMFTKRTGDRRLEARLVSIASRMSQTAGLYRKPTESTLDPIEATNRSRALWTGLILDADLSINNGLPVVDLDQDVEAEVPAEVSLDGYGLLKLPQGTANIFRLRAELAFIQARVARHLYSANPRLRTDRHLLATVADLDSALEEYRLRIPLDIRPGSSDQRADALQEIPVATLLFSYHNCVSMVHWAALQHSTWQTAVELSSKGFAVEMPCPQVTASISKFRAAARATLQIFEHLPTQQYTDLWPILCYPISASITVLAGLLWEPADQEACHDTELIKSLVVLSERMVKDEGCDLHGVLLGLSEILKITNEVVTHAKMTQLAHGAISGGGEHIQKISFLLRRSTHPMYLVQGMMSNLPNRDAEIMKEVSKVFVPSKEETGMYGCFVPESLRRETYDFTFSSSFSNRSS